MWEYTKKTLDLFFNPKNLGEMENADAVGEVGSIVCGDALKLYLKIDKKTNRIVDARFQTFGCGSAIASSSALTEMVKGKTIEEAMKLTNEDIVNFLGGLPKEKIHCSVMGMEALHAAIADYRGEKTKPAHEEGTLLCFCMGVTKEKVKQMVMENNLTTVEEVTNYTKAGGGCGGCHPDIEEIIKEVWEEKKKGLKSRGEPQKLTNIQKIVLIQQTVDHEVRPSLKKDGGDIELVDVVDDIVLVRLKGSCSECKAAGTTLKGFVEKKLHEFVSPGLVVEEV